MNLQAHWQSAAPGVEGNHVGNSGNSERYADGHVFGSPGLSTISRMLPSKFQVDVSIVDPNAVTAGQPPR